MNFNKVLIAGNMTRDPLIKQLPTTTITEFGIATNRKFKTQSGEDREEVCFVDCVAFGKTAEIIAEFFKKGKPIFLEGRLKFDSWDAKDGGKRSKLSVVVENFRFCGGNAGDGAKKQSDDQGSIPDSPTGEAGKFDDSEIPFD